MSLRLRLFLLLGVLGALLALGQGWLIRTLTGELRGELATAAEAVGREVVQVLKVPAESPADGEAVPRRLRVERRVTIERPGEEPIVEERVTQLDDVGVELTPDERELILGSPSERLARVRVPAAGVEQAVAGFRRKLLLGSLALWTLGLAAAFVLAGRVAAPLGRLAAAAERVGGGELGVSVPVAAGSRGVAGAGEGGELSTDEHGDRGGGDEVSRAIRAFNRMSGRLVELDAAARDARARHHLAELGEVARGLAHSLRNPLNALGLTVDELADAAPGGAGGDDARREALAAAAREQIRRLDAGLRTLLALGDAGAAPVERVDLLAVARDVALEALAGARDGVRVEVEGEPATVEGFEAELRSAIHALVVNAVEASPPKSTVHVRVERVDRVERSGSDEGRVRLAVEDRGPGLSPEVRARLFTPHLTTKPDGSGLGLYLAHRLATGRYRGTLELAGRKGDGGTRAVLELGDRVASDADGAAAGA